MNGKSTSGGKMYPGSTGYFNVVINPNQTEVAVSYIINMSNLPVGVSITTYEFADDENHTQYEVTNNTIEGFIELNPNRTALNSSNSKTLKVHWKFDEVLIDVNALGSGELNYTINVSVTTRQRIEKDIKVKYVFSEGNVKFDGATSLITDVGLFSASNVSRDFELTTKIEKHLFNGNKCTYLGCLDHTDTTAKLYPGFTFRAPNNSNMAFIRRSTSSNKIDDSRANYGINAIQDIKLVRTGSVLYYDFNNTGNLQEAINYSDLVHTFDSPLKFGSDFKDTMEPNSFSVAVMSNITLQMVYSSNEESTTLPSPTRTNYSFGGWYADSNFTQKIGDGGSTYTFGGDDITLYAKWTKVYDERNEYTKSEQVFNNTSSSIVKTKFYPFSQDNMHKNFEISLDIENMTANASYRNVVWSENNSIQFRVGETQHNYNMRTDISNKKSIDIPIEDISIKILRINDIIYFKLNNNDPVQLVNLENYTIYSELPILIGGGYYDEYDRLQFAANYTCTFKNIKLKYISNNVTIDDYKRTRGSLAVFYQNTGPVTFNGTSDYIIPADAVYTSGLKLFDTQNYDKDFEISFTIDNASNENVAFNTLLCCKVENGRGFYFRYASDALTYDFNARDANNVHSVSATVPLATQTVKIERRLGKIYLTLDGGTEAELIDSSQSYFFIDNPLIIGCALDTTSTPFRFFKGTLSNIVIKLEQ